MDELKKEDNRKFMLRAIELARNGLGHVSPNPMVGCVIIKNNLIIGEGWHRQYGGHHAEANAIESIRENIPLQNAELFVTLEPCAHHGKTPPCADLIISRGIGRVWIANRDPNPLVAGKGIEKLEKAGVQVSTGICMEEAGEMNKRYFTAFNKNRPYVILKWAETSDGFIAGDIPAPRWISNELSRQIVHKWR